MNLESQVSQLVQSVMSEVIAKIQEQAAKQVAVDISRHIAAIDFNGMIRTTISDHLTGKLSDFSFPDSSIPGTAINLPTFRISGDNVIGGIIQNFGSTGIQDCATDCKMTILDDATIFENNLLANTAVFKGDLTVEGDFNLRGEMPSDSQFMEDLVSLSAGRVRLALNDDMFSQYAGLVFNKIAENGIDLSKITIGQRSVIEGNQLGYFITESNLQKVGELRQLVVTGESQLSGSLYTGNKRVGINTIEPAGALSVWDEETEVVVRKLKKDTSIIGSIRNQDVVLSSNNKDNMTLNTDGSVSVNKLNIGQVTVISSPTKPSYVARRGTVVFNEAPEVGGVVGWTSLGSGQWANFGVIQ